MRDYLTREETKEINRRLENVLSNPALREQALDTVADWLYDSDMIRGKKDNYGLNDFYEILEENGILKGKNEELERDNEYLEFQNSELEKNLASLKA